MADRRKAPRFDDPRPVSEQSSRIKRRTPRQDTRAEMLLRRALWHRGARYRLHVKELPGKPDLKFIGPRKPGRLRGRIHMAEDFESCQEEANEGFPGV